MPAATPTPTGPELGADDTISMIDAHRPALEAGEYTITATHTLQGAALGKPSVATIFVAGVRLALAPAEVHAVYPPAGASGQFAGVLAHVVLERAGRPWERAAEHVASDRDAPWLAVVVLSPSEIETETTVDSATLLTSSPSFRALPSEPGHSGDDGDGGNVAVVDIAAATAQSILPTADELQLLTHVRRVVSSAGETSAERAVCVSLRLAPVGTCIAHLVSLEGQYENGSHWSVTDTGATTVRLVSLKRWEFTTQEEPAHEFAELATTLDSDRLRLTTPAASDALAVQIDRGAVPVEFQLQSGQIAPAWYRGPLTPDPLADADPASERRRAEQLLVLDTATGMVDVSYAAAWELGRLLTLQDARIAGQLHEWKRRSAHRDRRLAQAALHPDLEVEVEAPPEFPLTDWLTSRVVHLRGVPFVYLVPDAAMLPTESIRFFDVDLLWVRALLDGAFSIGRTSQRESELDADRADVLPAIDAMSGLLLRSALVAGWPSMVVDGYSTTEVTVEGLPEASARLDVVRYERLAPDTLLVLFAGSAELVALHLHPQLLHFGFEPNPDRNTDPPPAHRFVVTARTDRGVPERDGELGVVDITTLAQDLLGAQPTSDALALELIDRAPLVTLRTGAGPAATTPDASTGLDEPDEPDAPDPPAGLDVEEP